MFKKLKEKISNKFKTFPRSDTIDFPEVNEGLKLILEEKKRLNFEVRTFNGSPSDPLNFPLETRSCLLNSGNILISYFKRIRERNRGDLYSFLEIYSIPNLKLIQKYEFPFKEEGTIYFVTNAFQLKNGNVFAVFDRFYQFQGESIQEGPIFKSEKLDYSDFTERHEIEYYNMFDKLEKKVTVKGFSIGNYFEVKEGKILFISKTNDKIRLFDPSEKSPKLKTIYQQKKSDSLFEKKTQSFDIILPSKYYPENLYIVCNEVAPSIPPSSSKLLIFNLNEFIDESSNNKEPLSTMVISESKFALGMCEYDKKYLLFDTLENGIYIFDMDTKTKVAVCDVEINRPVSDSYKYAYQNLTRLESGHVFRNRRYGYGFGLVDIKKRKEKTCGDAWIDDAIIKGKYLIGIGPNTQMIVYQIYE